MSERDKLRAIGKANVDRAWSDKEKQDFVGVFGGAQPAAPTPTPAPAVGIEDGIAAQQAANLEAAKTNPGMQEKLNAVAKARAKYLGEDQ